MVKKMSKDLISTLNHDLEDWHKEEMNELKRSTKYAKKSLLIAGITLIVMELRFEILNNIMFFH